MIAVGMFAVDIFNLRLIGPRDQELWVPFSIECTKPKFGVAVGIRYTCLYSLCSEWSTFIAKFFIWRSWEVWIRSYDLQTVLGTYDPNLNFQVFFFEISEKFECNFVFWGVSMVKEHDLKFFFFFFFFFLKFFFFFFFLRFRV